MKTTKHTHQMSYGRRVAGCPRCAELAAGAPAVQWRKRQSDDARRTVEIAAHCDGPTHMSGGCGPVCTFGEW